MRMSPPKSESEYPSPASAPALDKLRGMLRRFGSDTQRKGSEYHQSGRAPQRARLTSPEVSPESQAWLGLARKPPDPGLMSPAPEAVTASIAGPTRRRRRPA